MKKIIRITTVPNSLKGLLSGQLRYMSKYFDVIAISSPGEVLLEYQTNEQIKVYAVQIKRKPNPFWDLISIYKLYWIFKLEKPTIVHTHTPKAGMVGMIAAFFAMVPIRLHTVAGLPFMTRHGLTKKILVFVEKITYKFATNVYPNSFGLKDYIISLGIIKLDKMKVIGQGSSNGIDLSYFDPEIISKESIQLVRKANGINESDFVFIYIGRIVKDKGVNELVLAFRNLSKVYSNIKLLMLGEYEDDLDPIDNKCKIYIENSSKVILTGYQNDIRPYLKIADVFVHPSYREGFPNVVLQACAFKKACIVTNINGSNEIVKNGKNGLIVPVKDTNKLQEAMRDLLINENKRNVFSLNSHNSVKNYSRINVWKNIHMEYNTLISDYYSS